MIKLYSSPVCSACLALKSFLKENNIEFEEIDVLKNKEGAEEMIKKSGQEHIPVLDINGKVIIGFQEKEILEALK